MKANKMLRIPEIPPQIAPLTDNNSRPLWSVMIPCYNCSNYLPEAIQSVLAQDMGEEIMQIEVVDDCSTDEDVEQLVKKIGKGRVKYFRQEKNIGSLRNFETCINRARGKYVHLLHGDDRSKTGYYIAITELFEKYPNAGAAFCAWDYIKQDGSFDHKSRLEASESCILEDWLFKLAEQPRLQYVTITVKREVYEALGSFYLVTYGEDWEMWARIAKHYPTAYTPEFLAEYREHTNSITWNSYKDGQNFRDLTKVMKVINSYLPKNTQHKMARKTIKTYTHWVIDFAVNIWFVEKNKAASYKQIKTILITYVDADILIKITKLLLYMWTEPYRKYLKRSPN